MQSACAYGAPLPDFYVAVSHSWTFVEACRSVRLFVLLIFAFVAGDSFFFLTCCTVDFLLNFNFSKIRPTARRCPFGACPMRKICSLLQILKQVLPGVAYGISMMTTDWKKYPDITSRDFSEVLTDSRVTIHVGILICLSSNQLPTQNRLQ